MDSRESFEEVVRLRENILETKWAALNPGSGFKKKSLPKIPMILAGNKCDRDFKWVYLILTAQFTQESYLKIMVS